MNELQEFWLMLYILLVNEKRYEIKKLLVSFGRFNHDS